jgi:predicted AlkP superfamily pyrophosphatase or phosphodiesterase
MSPADKLTQVLNWLDQDLSDRPHLITTYIPNVDQQGHKGGPESVEVEEALGLVDDFVGNLVLGIQDRNLTDIVNVVVVSDHGEHRAFVSCREAAVS